MQAEELLLLRDGYGPMQKRRVRASCGDEAGTRWPDGSRLLERTSCVNPLGG